MGFSGESYANSLIKLTNGGNNGLQGFLDLIKCFNILQYNKLIYIWIKDIGHIHASDGVRKGATNNT